MKLQIYPVRQRKKGRTKVWVDCAEDQAQQYEIRWRGKLIRRLHSRAEAEELCSRPKKKPPVDRHRLLGKRWDDVKDRL